MFMTILISFIVLIALICLAVAPKLEKSSPSGEVSSRGGAIAAGSVLLLIALIIGLFSSLTIVQPRTVGVKVALGKPVDVIGHGIHWKAPWTKVEKLDGAVQNDVYNGKSAVDVRLGNNGKASVDASIQWQLKTDDAMAVFLDYKTFEGIQSNLVDRNFKASLNEVMAGYDPLNYADSAKGGADLEALAAKVEDKMTEKVGHQIKVRSVTLPLINFDKSTQSRINDLQAEAARTRVAEQKKSTNKAEAQANALIEKSISEGTLTSKCLDIVKETKQSPLGCFPGTDVSPVKSVSGK
jgi:regulator of protease activity HflC (stomatin/prohibitin superfamily)